MEVNWKSEEVEDTYPFLYDFVKRAKNLTYCPLSYPNGLAAYVADHYLHLSNLYPYLKEELSEGYYRYYNDPELLLKTNDTLKISTDLVFTNKFHKLIKKSIDIKVIKDLSTWYSFLQTDSPFARFIGVI